MDRLYNVPPRKKGGHIFYIHWKENVNRRCRLCQRLHRQRQISACAIMRRRL